MYRLFDCYPALGPVGAVAFDLEPHLFIVAAFCSRDEGDAIHLLGERLRIATLAAADAPEDESYRMSGAFMLHKRRTS
jgi:hypothetical protein